ncbi:MAG: hypothetical protein ACFFFH_20725 [Candidatus Thorarchaeota archaeon]
MSLIFIFSERLQQWSTRKNILIILTLFILFIFSLPILYLLYPPANDMKSLDDPVIYTTAEIYEILESWGETGRFYQMWFHVTWDLAVPILYALFLAFILSWLFQQSLKPENPLQKSNLLAILGGMFDLLENLSIFTLILSYPNQIELLALFKNCFTALKYLLGIVIFCLIFLGLLILARNRITKKD